MRIVQRGAGVALLVCGLVVLGIEGCAVVEVTAGRARVTSVWFWILLTAIGLYLTLTGLETLVIGSKRLARVLYRLLAFAAPMARNNGHVGARLPALQPEPIEERLRWRRFWARFRRRPRRG